jgi:OmcA/MtrC family decaheme c-type cytochrome
MPASAPERAVKNPYKRIRRSNLHDLNQAYDHVAESRFAAGWEGAVVIVRGAEVQPSFGCRCCDCPAGETRRSSMKKMSLRPWIALAGAGLLATVIAGCGGSDGKDGAPGADGATGATGATGPAGPSADTPIFNSNSTAPTPAQTATWSALTPQVTVTSVTIASPPVVTFTVKDAYGNPVVGLGSKSKSGTATVASLANISFTLAKLVPAQTTTGGGKTFNTEPSKWVSYLVIKPVTVAQAGGTIGSADACNNTASAVATWCGTYPTVDREGTLKDNGDGTYEYTFYRDVTQVATIVGGLNDSADGFAKKADLGDLTYDGTLTHRLGIQIGGNAPGTGSNTPNATTSVTAVAMAKPANVWYDFIPAGGDVTTTRQVVQLDSCSSCHDGKVLAHGQRKDPNYCVTCHTDQIKFAFNGGEAPMLADGITFAVQTGTNAQVRPKQAIVDGRAVGNYPNMIHKTHMGEELVRQGYNFNNASEGLYNTFAFPQDPSNCTKCHNGTATTDPLVAKVTPNGDNWKNNPSMLACGACHDGINFATGKGITLADKAAGVIDIANGSGHVGGPQTDNGACNLCHNAGNIPLYHQTNYATSNNPVPKDGASTFAYELNSVTLNANRQPVFKFKITKDGATVTSLPIAGFTGGPSFYIAFAVPQDGIAAPADFNATANASLANLLSGANGTFVSTTADGSGYFTVTLTGTVASPVTVPANAKIVTGAMIGNFTQTSLARQAPTRLAMKAVSSTDARRAIVASSKCDACHDQLGTSPSFHGGARNDPQACNFCHTGNRTSSGWSADSSTFVHGIHGAEKRSVAFTWHATSPTDNYSEIGYPGVLQDCNQCHLPNTVNFGANGATLQSSLLWSTTATGIFNGNVGTLTNGCTVTATNNCLATETSVAALSPYVIKDNTYSYGSGFSFNVATGATTEAAATTLVNSPIASACFACHDTDAARGHMSSNGGAIYEPRSTALQKIEGCLVCHGAGKEYDAAVVHSK